MLEVLFSILFDVRDVHAVDVSKLTDKFVQFVFQFTLGATGQDFLLHVILYKFAALANFDRCFLLVSSQNPHLDIGLNKHIYGLGYAKLKLILNSS